MMISVPVEAAKSLHTYAELREWACKVGPKRVGVAFADDEVALTAAAEAMRSRIADPVLIGDEKSIRARIQALGFADLADQAEFVPAADDAAQIAVRMAREGAIDILMKGHLRTDQLLHPVLDKEKGLRTGRLLCDIAFFEHADPAGPRLVGIVDGGLNPAPTLPQKKQIVLSAIEVLRAMGIERPKIAVMSAVEVPSEAIPSTMDAKALTEMCVAGEFGDADVFGPLALDNALFDWAAKIKGITSPVAGHADCLIVPSIEAGNMLAKSINWLVGCEFGHVVVGAKVPILIPSRVERAQDKINAMALGVLYACR